MKEAAMESLAADDDDFVIAPPEPKSKSLRPAKLRPRMIRA
jgi:hypothetical protein